MDSVLVRICILLNSLTHGPSATFEFDDQSIICLFVCLFVNYLAFRQNKVTLKQ
jgi:hypothetical protein